MQADGMNLDSHKMMFHPAEVSSWMKGERTWPINVEIGLSGACNHRCKFCAFDYLEYKPQYLNTVNLLNNLKEMSEKGLKSILYAGFGEPLLHKDAPMIIHESKSIGIDCALSTNGVLFSADKQIECLNDLSWIRFSVAAPTAKTYSQIHQCNVKDFDKLVENISHAVKLRNDNAGKTTFGIQMLIMKESVEEIPLMAKLGKELGVDYVSIKPFNQGHKVRNDYVVEEDYVLDMYRRAKEYESDDFRVFIRNNLMKQHRICKPVYDKCGMLDFFCIINADGSVIPCTVFPGEEEFVYGNIETERFASIWIGEKRAKIVERINKPEFFSKYCYSEDCKMRMQNTYLHQLKNPHPHVNFV